jgi:hypothetical protein
VRVFLGLLLFAAAFLLASTIHRQWTDGVRREREGLRERRQLAAADDFETWGRAELVFGRPSGREPLDVELPGPAEDAVLAGSSTSDAAADGAPPSDWTPPVYEMTVQRGQVLSTICQDFYGTSRPPLPDQVAVFNGLEDADSVRAGQVLRLPPLSMLRESNP